jgi:hypothetical protein
MAIQIHKIVDVVQKVTISTSSYLALCRSGIVRLAVDPIYRHQHSLEMAAIHESR